MRTSYVTAISLCMVCTYKQNPLPFTTKEGLCACSFFSFLGEGVSILWEGESQAKIMLIFKFWMLFA